MRAGDIAGFRDLSGVLEERSDTGPRVQRARLAESGHELLPFIEEQVDIGLADLGLVRIRYEHVGGADHAGGAKRQQYVAVGRTLASIDTDVDETVVHRDHQAHPCTHVDCATSEFGDLTGPGTGGVDDNSGSNCEFLAASLAANVRTHHPVTIDLEIQHPVIREDSGSMLLR